MAAQRPLDAQSSFRRELRARGGQSALRCYQCGTCSTACNLAPPGAPFPRRQVLRAQWGLADDLMNDPAPWLCHGCNDCTTRCPRDAKPGDVMATVRALTVERLAVPSVVARIVGNAGVTWPLLLGLPILFWALLIPLALGGYHIPETGNWGYEHFVPHWLLYAVYFSTTALVCLSLWISGRRFWSGLDGAQQRRGSFLGSLWTVCLEVLTHKRFDECTAAKSRRLPHLALVWGFIGAAVTSGLLIVHIYILDGDLPIPQYHPFKVLGNLSALLLLYGGGALVVTRIRDAVAAGNSTAFDKFFLWVVALVIVTGCLVELWRLALDPTTACILYILHLGVVLCLFLTLPYSKFAHLVYRTLALVHQRMTEAAPEPNTPAEAPTSA